MVGDGQERTKKGTRINWEREFKETFCFVEKLKNLDYFNNFSQLGLHIHIFFNMYYEDLDCLLTNLSEPRVVHVPKAPYHPPKKGVFLNGDCAKLLFDSWKLQEQTSEEDFQQTTTTSDFLKEKVFVIHCKMFDLRKVDVFNFEILPVNIVELELSFCKLTNIPSSICRLKWLRNLILVGNNLTCIPNSLFDIDLYELDLTYNLELGSFAMRYCYSDLDRLLDELDPQKTGHPLISLNCILVLRDDLKKQNLLMDWSQNWRTCDHFKFPSFVRKNIFCWLLVCCRIKIFPKDIVQYVCKFIATEPETQPPCSHEAHNSVYERERNKTQKFFFVSSQVGLYN